MCGCNKNRNKSTSLNRSKSSVNCPNKRNQLNALKLSAANKASVSDDESSKIALNKIVVDIENYLANDSVCPQASYISAIKQTINGFK